MSQRPTSTTPDPEMTAPFNPASAPEKKLGTEAQAAPECLSPAAQQAATPATGKAPAPVPRRDTD